MVNILVAISPFVLLLIFIRNELVYHMRSRGYRKLPFWPKERYDAAIVEYRKRGYISQLFDLRLWTFNQFYPFLKEEVIQPLPEKVQAHGIQGYSREVNKDSF